MLHIQDSSAHETLVKTGNPVNTLKHDASLKNLTDRCLIHIFNLLPLADRIRIGRVCKHWRSLSESSLHSLKSLSFNASLWGLPIWKNLEDLPLREILSHVSRCVSHIDLSGVPSESAQRLLSFLRATDFPELCRVDVSEMELSSTGLVHLASICENIEELRIGESLWTCVLGSCGKLKRLEIFGDGKDQADSSIWDRDQNLEELVLKRCLVSSKRFCDAMKRLNKLHTLCVMSCVKLEDEAIETAVASLKSVKTLGLCGYLPLVTCAGLSSITRMTELESLDLSDNPLVSDDLLKAVCESCEKLRRVDISGCCDVSNSGLSRVARLPLLEVLRMDRLAKVNDEPLSGCAKLRSLRCRGCNVFDGGLLGLVAASPGLESLDLAGCVCVTARFCNDAGKLRLAGARPLGVNVRGTSVLPSELRRDSDSLKLHGLEERPPLVNRSQSLIDEVNWCDSGSDDDCEAAAYCSTSDDDS